MNSTAIKKRMKELNMTQGQVAAKMKISQCVLSQKINNKRPTTVEEADVLQRILKVSDADFRFFFLSKEVA